MIAMSTANAPEPSRYTRVKAGRTKFQLVMDQVDFDAIRADSGVGHEDKDMTAWVIDAIRRKLRLRARRIAA